MSIQIKTGRDVYLARKSRKIAQRNFAQRLGVELGVLRSIENGVPIFTDEIRVRAMAVIKQFDSERDAARRKTARRLLTPMETSL